MLQRCVHILGLSQFYLNPNCSISLTTIMRVSLFNVCSFNGWTLEKSLQFNLSFLDHNEGHYVSIAFFVSSIIIQYHFLWFLDGNLFINYMRMWKIYIISIYFNIWCFLVCSVTLILCIFLCQFHIFWFFQV